MKKRVPIAQTILTLVPLAILCVLYGIWFAVDRPAYVESIVMSLVITVGFAWLLLRYVPQFLRALSGNEQPLLTEDGLRMRRKASWGELFLILFYLLLFRIAVMAVAYAIHNAVNGYTGTFITVQRLWASYSDAPHYLSIAAKGYLSEGASTNYEYLNLVFLPFYSYCVRIVSWFGINLVRSGFMISNGAAMCGAVVLYLLVKMDYGRACAGRSVVYYCILPAACLLFATMSDGLFFFLSVLAMYCVRKEKYWLASICAALAAYTRLLGIVLIVPIAIEYVSYLVSKRRLDPHPNLLAAVLRVLNGVSLILIPLAFSLYLLQNYMISGNAFQFLIYQQENWSQSFAPFFNTAGYQTDYLVNAFLNHDYESALALWIPNILYVFGSLGLILATMKRMRASYVGYFIAYFFMSVSASWLLSAPRYLTCCFPVIIAVAMLTDKRRVNVPVMLLSITCFVLYLYAFIARYPVY